MTAEIVIFACATVGLSGTTDVHVKQHADGAFEARMGFALMGATNMDKAGFERCDHNPFHEEFYDNFAKGIGATADEAIEALKRDMVRTAESVWAT